MHWYKFMEIKSWLKNNGMHMAKEEVAEGRKEVIE